MKKILIITVGEMNLKKSGIKRNVSLEINYQEETNYV